MRETGCSCVLTVLDGTDAINIEEVLAGTRSALRVTGQRSHALLTAAGRALVAFSDPEVRRDVLERPVPRATSETLTAPTALRELLADVRSAGVCVSRRPADMGFDGVAAPIVDPSGTARAALGLVVPTRAPDLASLARTTAVAGRAASLVLSPLPSAPQHSAKADGAPAFRV